MKRVWSCTNPPGSDAPVVALDVQLAPWGGLFLRSLREVARKQGCVLVLLCRGGHEFASHVAEQQGFHHVVDCHALGEGHCSVVRRLSEGVAVVGSEAVVETLRFVVKGIVFNPERLPADILAYGSAASATRIKEVGDILEVLAPTRVFRDGQVMLSSVGLDQVLPASLATPVEELLTKLVATQHPL